jgi:hypothetical protein
MAEVTEFISTFHHSFRNIQVFSTTSGWYAITVGQVPVDIGPAYIKKYVYYSLILDDSLCLSGDTYLKEANWRNQTPDQETEYEGRNGGKNILHFRKTISAATQNLLR